MKMSTDNRLPFFSVICHNIRSLHNVGSIFRSADAFGIDHIFLTGYTPAPPRREIQKVALGAERSIPWTKFAVAWRLLQKLQKEKVHIAALESGCKGIHIARFKPVFPLALILGNELQGLSQSLLSYADSIVEIPMFGSKTSLNVSVAFGVAAYAITISQNSKRKIEGRY